MSEKIIVIGEVQNEAIRGVSFEIIAAARKINETSEVVAVLLSDKALDECAAEMIHYGADRVITITHDSLAHYTPEGYAQALLAIIAEESPSAIFMGHTAIGKDLTPKIAAKLDIGLVSDIIDLKLESGQVVFTRPIYSGKAFEKKIVRDGIIFATVRPNNIARLEKDEARTGIVETKEVEIKSLSTTIKEVIRKQYEGIDMAEASVVVAGGRGVKDEAGFQLIEQLAASLGAAVGASRGACDAGFCEYSLQIGQTGKVITPDVYIAVGISGAIQHVAGVSNAKTIIAINKDPEAEIFNIADYGIVGDLFEVVPRLIEEINNLKVSI